MDETTPFVTMIHSVTGGVAETHLDAFEMLWKDKGWQLLDKGADLEKVTREQLERAAADHGVDVSDAKTKADIAEKLKGEVNG